MLVVNIL